MSGYIEQHTPFSENVTGPTMSNYSRGGRLKLVWHATDNLSFNLSGSYGEQSGNDGYGMGLARVAPDLSAIIPQDNYGNYKYGSDIAAGAVNYSQLYTAGADWKLPWVELKAITSDQKLDSPYQAFDYDGSPLPLISFNSFDEFFHQGSAELQILSTDGTPLSKYVTWVAGAYYLEANGGFPNLNLQVAQGQPVGGLLSAIPGLDPLLIKVNSLLGGLGLPPIPLLTGPVTLVSGGLLSTRSFSGYLQTTTHLQEIFGLSQPLNLILGGRLDKESRGLSDNRLAIENPLSTVPQQITLLTFSVPNVSALQVPIKAEVQWFPADGTQIYTSFSRGFTAPTYSTVNFTGAPNSVQGSKVNSYEVGLKTQLLDGGLTLNTAAFMTDEREVITGFASITSGGIIEYDNVPRARIRGVEGDFTLQPTPNLDPGLVILGSASYLHAKYTNYPDGRGYDPNTGLSFGPNNPIPILGAPRNFAGHDIDRVPNFTYNLGVNQSIPLNDNSRFEIDVATNYSTGYYYDPQNAPQYAQNSAFQLVDASVSYFYKPWGLEVTGYGTNLTREFYDTSTFVLDTGEFREPNAPRIFGLRTKYTF
jgi:iron complex outermembrane recepter protein